MIAGLSSFLSLKNKSNVVEILMERIFKLIMAFIFGLIVIGMPSNFVLFELYKPIYVSKKTWTYAQKLTLENIFSFVTNLHNYTAPGHLTFLPYLFIIFAIHLPLCLFLVKTIKGHHYDEKDFYSSKNKERDDDDILGNNNDDRDNSFDFGEKNSKIFDLTTKQKAFSGLYMVILCTSIGYEGTKIFLGILLILYSIIKLFNVECGIHRNVINQQILRNKFQLNSQNSDNHEDYVRVKFSLEDAIKFLINRVTVSNSKFLIGYTLLLPVIQAIVFHWIFKGQYNIPMISILFIYFFPLAILMLPYTTMYFHIIPKQLKLVVNRYRDYTLLPVNLLLVAILSIVVGQLFLLTYPEYIHWLSNEVPEEVKRYNIFQLMIEGYLPQKKIYAVFLMYYGHSSFYMVGFIWLLVSYRLPEKPQPQTGNWSGIFFCISIIIMPGFLFLGKSGFFYVTSGYVSYHHRLNRFFYAVGSWLWCWACVLYLETAGDETYEGNSWVKKIFRFLRDSTFATFLFHPLFGYIVSLPLKNLDISFVSKIIILDVSVYILCFLWFWILIKIPYLYLLFGIKKPT
eukprot:TRINITY_DN4262_c0_g1_i1.p1 TRINITY_DN4262_c0_g1~~TRINITY_DN4262_c0_g1_i1.p1  ORF type:complete len:569 (-),score=62.87 TRINITY_DN4262_c0_g1_i1:216-1922(-)